MFTILYFLVRIMMYGPKEGSDFSDMMRDLIIDPITFVFAGIMIAAIIATRVMRKDVERKKTVTGSVMLCVILFLIFVPAGLTHSYLKLPDADYLKVTIIYFIIAICILSLVFIVISIINGQGVMDGLIDMFDFEMQGILWVILGFGCLMILGLPIIIIAMAGAGSGSGSRDDDDFWVWYFFLR